MAIKSERTIKAPCRMTLDCQDTAETGTEFTELQIDNGCGAWTETVCADHIEEVRQTADAR